MLDYFKIIQIYASYLSMIQQCHVNLILRDMFALAKPIIILIKMTDLRWTFCHD